MNHKNLQWMCGCLLLNLVLLQSIKPSFCIHDPNYTACAPQSCGGGVGAGMNISYPFWINGQQESRCGFPGFDVSCSTQNETIIRLYGSNYTIKNIYYNNQSIRVIDSDYVDLSSRNTCSVPFQNLTLYGERFEFGLNYTKLYVVTNCAPEIWRDLGEFKASGCLSWNESDPVFAVLENDFLNLTGKVAGKCEKLVEVPVELHDDEGKNGKLSGENWWQYLEEVVFERGIMWKWIASDCSDCTESGGRCGFDVNNHQLMCFCTDRLYFLGCPRTTRPSSVRIKLILAITMPVGVIIVGSIMLMVFMKRSGGHDHGLDEFIRNHGSLTLKQYSYSDVKKITNSFANKLGKGGYGCVYKGKLSDGRHVAVKILNESKGNSQEFLNEVDSISRTSHVNIVSLLGFCYKGTKRALIYEFMSHLSLDKFIYHGKASSKENIELDRATLFKIAIGIARGLEYLHSGCNTRILHLDIKPHNILLDQYWCPKISDFGLAKLCQTKESIISTIGARGTIGYIAPEVFNRGFGRVSYKSDVYSYGMMILEMTGVGKQAEIEGLTETSEMYFPNWIYKKLEDGLNGVALRDNAITGDEKDKELERKMIIVGLWCIQTRPADRPSMSKVIEMLEASSDLLQTPPKPYLFPPTSRSSRHYYSSSFASTSQAIDYQS